MPKFLQNFPIATNEESYLRLSKFIIMMREGKILSSTVDIHIVAEDLRGHDAAFNMPSRPSFSPR
jgi:hypothetical protein